MARLAELLATLATTGGDGILTDRDTAHVIASGHDVLSRRSLPDLELHAEAVTDGIMARVRVRRGTTIARPIHLCFGVLDPAGVQRITMSVALEEGAHATFIAHCVFPRARRVEHLMDATVDVGPDATMVYREAHFHGPFGGIEVVPRATVRLARGSRFVSEFALTTGRVGRLAIDYTVEAGDAALAELTARVFGHATDHIRIRERVVLAGAAARSLVKTRVAVEDEASAEVTNITEGTAEGARGHMDCLEIVRDRAAASALPIVRVTHPGAKVTHVAAIGSIEPKQLETLMARGLTPERAVDAIVRGILRGAEAPGPPGA